MMNKTLNEIITDYKGQDTTPLEEEEIRGLLADLGIELMFNEGHIDKKSYDEWKTGKTTGFQRVKKSVENDIRKILPTEKYSQQDINLILERIYPYICLNL